MSVRQTQRMEQLQKQRSTRWDAEFIDRVLWEVAAAGGTVTRAYNQLSEWGTQQADETGVMPDLPSLRTLRNWVNITYRNRYHEVQQQKVTEMDELIAQEGQRLAVQLADGEERALKQTLAGLASSNAVEASTILRNLSVSKKSQVDNAINLRRQQSGGIDGRSLQDLVSSLVRAGAGTLAEPTVEEDIVDAQVVDG